MNKATIAGLVVLAAGGVTLGLLGGGEEVGPGDVGPVVEAKAEARVAVLPGTCPTDGPAQDAPACVQSVQLDGKCICWTAQKAGTVDGEASSADALPAASRTRLVLCRGKDKEPSQARWEKDAGEPAAGCRTICRPMVDVTLGSEETDLVACLREACAPCVISGASWGRCPQCLDEPGGCAEACRE